MNSEIFSRPSVLIIDDNTSNIKVLAAALAHDYEITFATGGAEGLALAARCPPDLVLLDVMMPDMDGFETCSRLCSAPQLCDIPVIFISALEDVADKVKAFKVGGSDYITKPFQLEEVQARVSTHVNLYRAQRELREREEKQRQNLVELKAAHAKLKEMGNQLLQSEKLASIGQLAAGVAHEINNPIGFINSNLGTLKRYADQLLRLLDDYAAVESAVSSDLRQNIEDTKRQIDLEFLRQDMVSLIAESIDGVARVCRIVQNLRDFSRPGQDEWQAADLHAGLESTLNVVWHEIKYKADVVREYDELPLVECLPFQINQVFLNLLVNATQAIPEHGRITLRTRHEGEWVSIAISDNGNGIAPEILNKVFDPFFTTKPVGKGTGLGLAVSYGIIKNHGGRIDVASKPGLGATFTVHLPIKHPAGADSNSTDSPSAQVMKNAA